MTLKEARIGAGLSRNRAAVALGVHPNTLCNWEMHDREPSVSDARKMAALYRVPIESIIDDCYKK